MPRADLTGIGKDCDERQRGKGKRMSLTMKKVITLVICLFVAIAMVGVQTETASAAAAPKLAKKSMKVYQGGTAKLKVKNAKKAKITYRSMNKKIATIDKKGKIKGKKSGNTKIKVVVKKGGKKYKFYCKIRVKKAKIAVLDCGASKSVKVAKAYTVTDAPARGKKGGHADRQIKRMKKEASKAAIISIRVSDSDDVIYSSAIAKGLKVALKEKVDIIYYSCYSKGCTEDEEELVYECIDKKIPIVGPAGNDNGKDARKMNWMTEVEGCTVVGAWGDKGILKSSNTHANLYIEAGSTSAAAARYAGMLAAGHVYDVHYK